MKPLDPRLLRHARSARGVLAFGALLGLVRSIAILAWCWFLAQAITAAVLPALGGMGAFGPNSGRVAEGAFAVTDLPWLVGGGILALCMRSLAVWGMESLAATGAVRVKAQLRAAALDSLDRRSPLRDGGSRSDAELATILGRGLDALDGYFSGYVPQLILTAIATPIFILVLLIVDPASGITVLVVFPVIPVFMILIGLATQAVQDRQWTQLQHLSRSFLDVVSGLTTLRIFGRESRQSARIARETEEYRGRTMKVLRVTFLSGFVLDLAGTFSIALVAVTVGTRLTDGAFPLATGLFVLLLLPEVFIPIRQVGAAFHASTEGLAASQQVFDLIEQGDLAAGSSRVAEAEQTAKLMQAEPAHAGGHGHGHAQPGAASDSSARRGLRLSDVCLERGGRQVVGPVSFEVAPGEVVALAGPSGAGKTTVIAALLGFLTPSSGHIAHSAESAWCGQRPGLMQGTVAENVALGDTHPDAAQVAAALARVGLEAIEPELQLGALGAGVSGGQAQRIAVARALYRAWSRDADVLLLDEPTSALDAANEALVCQALRREAADGRAVLVVSHRQAVLDTADRTVAIATGVHA